MKIFTFLTTMLVASLALAGKPIFPVKSGVKPKIKIDNNKGFSAFHGGSEGTGGGGAAPSTPVSAEDLSDLIPKARLLLLLYVNNLDLTPERLPSYYKNLIYGQGDLLSKVKYVKITESSDAPCFDNQQNPVDGSIYIPSGKEGVCISTFNLSKTLSREDAEVQLAALFAHEYSHLVGANEAQATLIQKDVLKNTVGWSSSGVELFAKSLLSPLNSVQYPLGAILKLSSPIDWKEACMQVRELSNYLDPMFSSSDTQKDNLSLVSQYGQAWINTARWQIANFSFVACYEAYGNDSFYNPWQVSTSKYQAIFKDSSEVSVRDFAKVANRSLEKEPYLDQATLVKINNEQLFRAEVQRAYDLLHTIENEYWFPLWRASNNEN